MITLHPDDRLKCAAIRHVVANTSLANITHELETYRGIPSLHLAQSADTLSSGEYVLWEFCRSIADEGPGVSMFSAKGELDDHSRRVMVEALAIWFGLGVSEVAA